MQIVAVREPAEARLFIRMQAGFYRRDPHWIQPLTKDLVSVFDPEKNKAFRSGKLERWILKDDQGHPIGRIAAFTQKKYKNKGDEGPAGGFGFFECIQNQQAANCLLDTARNWLVQEGMVYMDGPINFGERDRWWGLVTEGFQEPLYGMNYNPPYYKTLLENYGFRLFYEQLCFSMLPKEPFQPKIWQRHALLAANPDFSAMHIRKNELDRFAKDFTTVYNRAWAGHGGLKELTEAQVKQMFKTMKPVMDERIIWFAYYKNEPVALFVNLPDLNQWFKYLHGHFGLLHKLYFLLIRRFVKNKKFTGLVFGVVPEWQGKGVDAYLIGETGKWVQSPALPYTEYEMQWIGDFNPKMINVAENLGDVSCSRKLTTYRLVLDPTKEYKRHPILT